MGKCDPKPTVGLSLILSGFRIEHYQTLSLRRDFWVLCNKLFPQNPMRWFSRFPLLKVRPITPPESPRQSNNSPDPDCKYCGGSGTRFANLIPRILVTYGSFWESCDCHNR